MSTYLQIKKRKIGDEGIQKKQTETSETDHQQKTTITECYSSQRGIQKVAALIKQLELALHDAVDAVDVGEDREDREISEGLNKETKKLVALHEKFSLAARSTSVVRNDGVLSREADLAKVKIEPGAAKPKVSTPQPVVPASNNYGTLYYLGNDITRPLPRPFSLRMYDPKDGDYVVHNFTRIRYQLQYRLLKALQELYEDGVYAVVVKYMQYISDQYDWECAQSVESDFWEIIFIRHSISEQAVPSLATEQGRKRFVKLLDCNNVGRNIGTHRLKLPLETLTWVVKHIFELLELCRDQEELANKAHRFYKELKKIGNFVSNRQTRAIQKEKDSITQMKKEEKQLKQCLHTCNPGDHFRVKQEVRDVITGIRVSQDRFQNNAFEEHEDIPDEQTKGLRTMIDELEDYLARKNKF